MVCCRPPQELPVFCVTLFRKPVEWSKSLFDSDIAGGRERCLRSVCRSASVILRCRRRSPCQSAVADSRSGGGVVDGSSAFVSQCSFSSFLHFVCSAKTASLKVREKGLHPFLGSSVSDLSDVGWHA